MSKKQPRKRIIDALMKYPEGLTLLALAEKTGLHRHTCTKYIHEMIGAGIVYQRYVGVAKLCYLKKKIESQTDEKKVLERLRRKSKGSVQTTLLIAVVILTFLLSESVIIAYENSSFLNNTNFSNTSPVTSTSNVSDFSNLLNISGNETNTTEITVGSSTNETSENNNGTVGTTNGTGFLVANNTGNDTVLGNSSNSTQFQNITGGFNASIESNVTSNETLEENGTVEKSNENLEDIIESITSELGNETFSEPSLSVSLDYPAKITRGQSISVKAELVNTGSLAKDVVLNWMLPYGFSLDSGKLSENCGDLNIDDVCYSEIGVMTNLSTGLGLNEIRVVVYYEE